MTRRKIEIAPGALAPTVRQLWSAATEKLQEADFGLLQMTNAKDRIEFEQGWTRSIDCLEQFWTRFFDEGKSQFSNFQPWAGAIDAQRKSDPLLHYLYQARHQSQHGRISLDWEEGQLQIAPGFTGHIRGLQIFSDGTFNLNAVPAHPSVCEATVVFSGGNARLPIVNNRKHKQLFEPPKEHCGTVLHGLSPMEAIRLGIEYYVTILNQAFVKFYPNHDSPTA
jgi:hypothetical protein